MTDAPESVRRICGAIVDQAMARCEREGIATQDFHRALLEEAKVGPFGDVPALFERTFRRLQTRSN